jgi:hypothetical protein
MKIIYPRLPGAGWAPVTLAARLAARMFEADLVEFSASNLRNRLHTPLGHMPRRRGKGGHCLIIAPRPAYLLSALNVDHWFPGYDYVSAWVIDSFWTEHIPRSSFRHVHLDQLFITDGELVDEWASSTNVPTAWVPVGSDVLGHGSNQADRPLDLQRVGRQPAAWEDDTTNEAACAGAGLTYGRRPGFDADAQRNQQSLRAALRSAKFTLSFSNKVSPAGYTHPTREYLTPRWTDALAAGAIVAGISPKCQTSATLLWPEAVLELDTTDLDVGVRVVADAVQQWTPARARTNYQRALERLDLRWRFDQMARVAGWQTGALSFELQRLQDTADAAS